MKRTKDNLPAAAANMINRGFNLPESTCRKIDRMKFDKVARTNSAIVVMAIDLLFKQKVV
jgi:hypothetical protein